jgi:putative spermidine/putrescine transport system permease protein
VAERQRLIVADTTELVTAPGSRTGPGAGRVSRPTKLPKPLQAVVRLAGVLPFAAYVILGLFVPLVAVLIGAFKNSATGAWTFSNISVAVHGTYLHGFENSLELSVITSILPGIFGLLIAYAIFTAKRGGKLLRQMVITASGVFANFGGVPLAFLFIASVTSTALVTGWLNDIGLNIYSLNFSLFNLFGVSLVYLYFQIPLMVLIILPALEGLRPAWREAAENLGAGSWSYWRYVGGPVLLPSFVSCLMLLFGSALSAYATAEALTGGTIALTSIQIGTLINGNVIATEANVGKALSLGMVLIIVIVMIVYVMLQRRAAKWLR